MAIHENETLKTENLHSTNFILRIPFIEITPHNTIFSLNHRTQNSSSANILSHRSMHQIVGDAEGLGAFLSAPKVMIHGVKTF